MNDVPHSLNIIYKLVEREASKDDEEWNEMITAFTIIKNEIYSSRDVIDQLQAKLHCIEEKAEEILYLTSHD